MGLSQHFGVFFSRSINCCNKIQDVNSFLLRHGDTGGDNGIPIFLPYRDLEDDAENIIIYCRNSNFHVVDSCF